MTITDVQLAALNSIGETLPELSFGYNSLLANVPLGDLIAGAGTSDSATLAAATSTVVADTNVQTGDKIVVQATDTAGAALTGVFVDTIVDGVSFTINHSNAAGTEVFNYTISR
jgi:hypothetical protein